MGKRQQAVKYKRKYINYLLNFPPVICTVQNKSVNYADIKEWMEDFASGYILKQKVL